MSGSLPEDVKSELDKLLWADLVIFQCPLYWFGLPAILKGWVDRCFAEGIVFGLSNGKWFDNGYLKGKKFLISMTTGGRETYFKSTGIVGDINLFIWPIAITMRKTGMDVLPAQLWYNIPHANDELRQRYLKDWESRLGTIFEESPVQFVPSRHFDPDKGFSLTEDYIRSREGSQYGPTVGHHLGRPVDPESLVFSSS